MIQTMHKSITIPKMRFGAQESLPALQTWTLRSSVLTDEHYHLEYHRAMEAAYKRQNPMPLLPLAVNSADHSKFLQLCRKRNMTVSAMFHYLLSQNV